MKTYLTETLGCKVNQYETRQIEEVLERAGLRCAEAEEAADVVVVNTCVVTAEAARQCRQTIRRLRRTHPPARLIVTGCYAAEAERAAVEEIDGIDLILGDKDELRRRLAEELGRSREGDAEAERGISRFAGHTRAFVKIQDGCDQFCSYCIVPTVRPHLWSRDPADVVTEVGRLVEAGHREIVLSGIHLGRYGREAGGTDALAALVERLAALRGTFRVRLSSIEGIEVSDRLLAAMAEGGDRVCPYLHLPLQSGDDGVLRAMRRPYTADEFLRCAEQARAKVAGLALTTDVIVGFPGESGEAFERTCGVVRRAGFSRLHVFPYSPRPGTPAAKMAEQVTTGEKRRRAAELRELGHDLAARFAESLVGREVTVLVETAADGAAAEGFDEHYVRTRVRSAGAAMKRGELVAARVRAARGGMLVAGAQG